MEIIILRISQYKEKDGIIEAISSEENLSFLARGIFDPKSKIALLNNPLTVADIELSEGKYAYKIIKSGTILLSPIKNNADLRYMSSLMMINEAVNYLLSEEEKPLVFSYLYSAIENIKNSDNPLKVVLPFLLHILKISGYDFEINECISCGSKKNITTFSFPDGGFICQKCYTNDIPKLFNKEQMLLIRNAFGIQTPYIDFTNISDEEVLFIFDKVVEFIYDSYGHKMKSYELIK